MFFVVGNFEAIFGHFQPVVAPHPPDGKKNILFHLFSPHPVDVWCGWCRTIGDQALSYKVIWFVFFYIIFGQSLCSLGWTFSESTVSSPLSAAGSSSAMAILFVTTSPDQENCNLRWMKEWQSTLSYFQKPNPWTWSTVSIWNISHTLTVVCATNGTLKNMSETCKPTWLYRKFLFNSHFGPIYWSKVILRHICLFCMHKIIYSANLSHVCLINFLRFSFKKPKGNSFWTN